jgi:hypothetical protein
MRGGSAMKGGDAGKQKVVALGYHTREGLCSWDTIEVE